MRNFSNTYIFVFATSMAIILAALLSFVAEELRPMQERNVELEKKSDILASVEMTEGVEDAEDRGAFIEELFNSYIVESYVINSEGEVQEGKDAFEITENIDAEMDKPAEERDLPLFVFEDGGEEKYIIPVRGKGLWGPVWGYIALRNDFNTISGTVFDHRAETPGLGAEINTDWFEDAFIGKTIFENGEFIGIKVVKGGADPSAMHSVDAISGGTITSKGVEDMIFNSLKPYVTYFKENKN